MKYQKNLVFGTKEGYNIFCIFVSETKLLKEVKIEYK